MRGGLVGIFMGLADSVPGISGGTVALVMGIYRRWITAIGRFDRTFVRLIGKRQFKDAAIHVDLMFLSGLAIGIGSGFVVGVLTVARFLEVDLLRQYLYSAFIGMVIASVFIIGRMISLQKALTPTATITWTVIPAVLAALVTFLTPTSWGDSPPIWFVFFAASIAICAMVLPGISGALLLLVLGIYKHLIAVAKQSIHLENLSANVLTIAVFAAGASLGLLTFSKFLKKMLADHSGPTLVALRGLMLGSIAALWPFQMLDEESKEQFGKAIYQRYIPTEFDIHWVGMILAMLLAGGIVVVVDRYARLQSKQAD